MKEELKRAVGPVAKDIVSPMKVAAPPANAPVANAPSAEEAAKVVLEVLAAKTGYEPDTIDMDMALETELGVDSIKRVEILSEVQKELKIEATDVEALSRTQTVGDVVEAMKEELKRASPAAPASAAPTPSPAQAAPPAKPTNGNLPSAEEAAKVVL